MPGLLVQHITRYGHQIGAVRISLVIHRPELPRQRQRLGFWKRKQAARQSISLPSPRGLKTYYNEKGKGLYKCGRGWEMRLSDRNRSFGRHVVARPLKALRVVLSRDNALRRLPPPYSAVTRFCPRLQLWALAAARIRRSLVDSEEIFLGPVPQLTIKFAFLTWFPFFTPFFFCLKKKIKMKAL